MSRHRAARLVIAATLAGACGLGVTIHAGAAGPHLSLDPSSGPPGTTVVATGTGFCATNPCGAVDIEFSGVPVRHGVQVANDGSFSTTFTVPGGTPAGANFVVAQQHDGSQVIQANASFDVTPSRPASTSSTSSSSTSSASKSSTQGSPSPSPSQTPATSASSTSAAAPSSSSTSSTRSSSSSSTGLPPASASSHRGGGLPAAAGALIALGVLALAGLGAWLVLRRRRTTSAEQGRPA